MQVGLGWMRWGAIFVLAGMGHAQAQTAWVNVDDGHSTPAHFTEDKAACDAAQPGHVGGARGAANVSNPYAVETPEWDRCMTNRGWREVASVDGSAATAGGAGLREELRKASSDLQGTVCRAWAFHALFEKTQCMGNHFTADQLRDPSLVTDEESRLLEAYEGKLRAFHQRVIDLHTSSLTVPVQRRQVVALLDELYGRSYELKAALQAHRITWGQYNTQRRQAGEAFTPRYNALMQQAGKV